MVRGKKAEQARPRAAKSPSAAGFDVASGHREEGRRHEQGQRQPDGLGGKTEDERSHEEATHGQPRPEEGEARRRARSREATILAQEDHGPVGDAAFGQGVEEGHEDEGPERGRVHRQGRRPWPAARSAMGSFGRETRREARAKRQVGRAEEHGEEGTRRPGRAGRWPGAALRSGPARSRRAGRRGRSRARGGRGAAGRRSWERPKCPLRGPSSEVPARTRRYENGRGSENARQRGRPGMRRARSCPGPGADAARAAGPGPRRRWRPGWRDRSGEGRSSRTRRPVKSRRSRKTVALAANDTCAMHCTKPPA